VCRTATIRASSKDIVVIEPRLGTPNVSLTVVLTSSMSHRLSARVLSAISKYRRLPLSSSHSKRAQRSLWGLQAQTNLKNTCDVLLASLVRSSDREPICQERFISNDDDSPGLVINGHKSVCEKDPAGFTALGLNAAFTLLLIGPRTDSLHIILSQFCRKNIDELCRTVLTTP
jgi:hypothetical protein